MSAPAVKARKGDLCGYRVLAGGYMTADHRRVEARPVWRVGRVERCSRDGEVQEIIDLRGGRVRKPEFGMVLVASQARFSAPAIERLTAEYVTRYSPENFATQGDFADAPDVIEFVKGFAS